MKIQLLKDRWLKLKEDYERKMMLVNELESLEKSLNSDTLIRKKKLDHELDHVEHIEQDHLDECRALFIAEVENNQPDLMLQLKTFLSAWQDAIEKERKVRLWDKYYQTILPHLNQILYIRSGMRGVGILQYLFGQRPTASITIEIQKIKEIMSLQKEEFNNPVLQELSRLVSKRWDFKQIDEEYSVLFKKLHAESELLLATQKKAAEEVLAAEINFFAWLKTV